MKTRVISGVVLAALMGSAIFIGGMYLYILCIFISTAGMYELYKIYNIESTALGIVGMLVSCVYYASIYADIDWVGSMSLSVGLMILMLVYVISFPKYNATQAMCSVFGVLYVSVMISFIFRTRCLEDGIYMVWLIFIASWVSDTFAYFTGVMFGKHKMTPQLSPKKSVEGAVGGVVSSVIVGAVYGYFVSDYVTVMMFPAAVVFGAACGIGALLSIVGDLTASAIKRSNNIKDYGSLIPGHGGVLDRFDSVIFTAPVVYWAVYIITVII